MVRSNFSLQGFVARRLAGRYRWLICALLFGATTINYMDRQILGLLAPALQRDIGWSEIEYGNIVIAFQIAYMIGLLAFGTLIDRFGTRAGYSASVAFWSVACAAHGLAHSVVGFGVARFALGLGEAGNFPAAVKAVTEWFPRKERALANGIFNSGANIGAVLAPLMVPWVAVNWGWQSAFVLLGAIGFLWLAAWHLFYQEPSMSIGLTPGELAHIRSDQAEEAGEKVSWGTLLRQRQAWVLIVGFGLTAPVWWFYLYWLPKFLSKQFGLDLTALGLPLVIIYSMTCFGSIGGGLLSSWLLRKGWSVSSSRKTAMLVCACFALPVLFASRVSEVWTATLLIGLAASAHQGWAANLFSLASDLFPRRMIGSVVGMGAMAGSLAAIVFSSSVGFILQATGSYMILFTISAFAYIVALAIMHLLSPKLEPMPGIHPGNPD